MKTGREVENGWYQLKGDNAGLRDDGCRKTLYSTVRKKYYVYIHANTLIKISSVNPGQGPRSLTGVDIATWIDYPNISCYQHYWGNILELVIFESGRFGNLKSDWENDFEMV